jgi:hypothetical protein
VAFPWNHAHAAAPRTVLVEAVTNLGSVGDADFRRMLDHTLGHVVNCEYVVMDAWWPAAKDPLFLRAASDIRGRVREAGIRKLPAILVDGVPLEGVVTAASLKDAIELRRRMPSVVALQVNVAPHADGWHVTVEAKGDLQSAARALVATTVLVEDEVSCPGRDGATFRSVFRGYIAGRAGQPMQGIGSGVWRWEGDVSLAADILTEHTRLLTTVRDAATGEILEARGTPLMGTGAGTAEEDDAIPRAYFLATPGLNPMPGGGVVSFGLPVDARVQLAVYNVEGRKVASLADGHMEAGRYSVTWAGEDGEGRKVSPGVYFVHLRANEWSGRQKVILAR